MMKDREAWPAVVHGNTTEQLNNGNNKLSNFIILICRLLLSCFSRVRLCDLMDRSTPGLPVHHQLPELAQTHVQWVGDAIQPSHPLLSPSPSAFNISQHQGLFQWVSSSHRWPKYWSFSFSISPSNEYSGLISFRIDWFDLLAVQGTLKSLLQHYNSKASIPLKLVMKLAAISEVSASGSRAYQTYIVNRILCTF